MSPEFQSTSWTVVLAGKKLDSAVSRQALDQLCADYWPPLYMYIRQRGYSEEDAKDLTQELFATLLERRFLESVEKGRGRFRYFLLACAKNFLASHQEKLQAQKRGGGHTPLHFDFASVEARFQTRQYSNLDPGTLFDRQWALSVLDSALRRLRDEFTSMGKKEIFKHLKGSLVSRKGDSSYRVLGGTLGMSEGAVKMAVNRMRTRYGQLIWDEVAKTVENPEDVSDEINYLIEVAGM